MGGLVTTFKFDREDSTISSLSQISAREVEEALSFYIEEYPSLLRVTYRHFDDIFGGTLNDIERSFLFFSDGKPEADLLEIFAVFIIACKGTAEWKVKMLFCLFDFDNSENIDKNEISLVLSAFTKALSKLGTGYPPTSSKLYLMASAIFKDIDKDNSQTLELNEIIQWSEKNEEFQELMAHFSHIQSLDLAKMRYEHILEEFSNFLSADIMTESVRRRLNEFFGSKRFNLHEVNDMIGHICLDGNVIDKQNMDRVGKSMIAFFVSDYTGQKSLSKQEIQIMMSLLAKEEKPLLIVENFMRKNGVARNNRLGLTIWMQALYKDHSLGPRPE